jgi:hypothetical protein
VRSTLATQPLISGLCSNMSKKSVRRVVSRYLTEAAYSLIAAGSALSEDEVRQLREQAPRLVKKIHGASPKNPLKALSTEEQRLLLAYVVYVRQNLIMDSNTIPNDEDAAQILHKEVFAEDDKKTKRRLSEELIRQLQKAGVTFKDDE